MNLIILSHIRIVTQKVKCNKVEIKEINLVETESNIQELNLCEIDIT